jgi:hypothetical protein
VNKTTDAAAISPEVLQAMNRRDFLKRAGCAAALALTASGLGLALYDQAGPPAVAPETGKILAGLGDYSLPSLAGKPGKMAIIRGVDRGRMVERGIQALGGMETFIQKGERVLIKVNAAFATPASLAATTHPETLAALVRLCFNAGAAQVLVTDNPINNPESCFEISGLAEATRAQGGRLVTPKAELFAPVSTMKRYGPLPSISTAAWIRPTRSSRVGAAYSASGFGCASSITGAWAGDVSSAVAPAVASTSMSNAPRIERRP